MGKTYHSMIEIEKDYFPHIYQERLDRLKEDELGKDQKLIQDNITYLQRIVSKALSKSSE